LEKLKCPSCGAPADPGSVICGNCDYVLDPNFFDTSADAGPGDERSNTPPDVPRQDTPASVPSATSGSFAAAGHPSHSAAPANRNPSPFAMLEEMWFDLRRVGAELDRSDRLAFFGGLSQLLWLFLPWQDSAQEGAVVGIMTVGIGILVGAAACTAGVLMRHRRLRPVADPLAPWLLQLVGTVFMVLWALFCLRAFWDGRLVSGYHSLRVPVSRPSLGTYVAFLSALISLTGSIWGFRQRAS
jgi:hypothetical protein